MAAFQSAWAKGVHGIELDVQCSRDGRIVVFHDEDGRRLAGKSGRISGSNWEDLRAWRIGGEPMPLLEDIMAAMPVDTLTLIELKCDAAAVPSIHSQLSSIRGKQFALLTFYPEVAKAASLREFPVWLNVEPDAGMGIDDLILLSQHIGLRGLSLGWSPRLTRNHFQAIKQAGLASAVWTVNDEHVAALLNTWPVDLLMTDDPGRMLKAFHKISAN